MIPIIKLKKEVEFNQELKNIVDALKGIAMGRFHILQRQLQLFEEFPKVASKFLSAIDLAHLNHPYVKSNSERTSLVCVTSDGGFLGGLNAKVIAAGLAEAGSDPRITVIGERGSSFLRDQKKEHRAFPGIEDGKRHQLASEVREHILKEILNRESGRLLIVYPKPISLAVQKVTLERLLPCTEWVPVGNGDEAPREIIWESGREDILSYVITFWIEHRIDEIFAMSRVAELGARVMHLEGSYQELVRNGKKLQLQYHRSRHEIIDRSMREVFATQLLFGRESDEGEDG